MLRGGKTIFRGGDAPPSNPIKKTCTVFMYGTVYHTENVEVKHIYICSTMRVGMKGTDISILVILPIRTLKNIEWVVQALTIANAMGGLDNFLTIPLLHSHSALYITSL